MLKKLLLTAVFIATASICHAIDGSVYRVNMPLDGRHVRETLVTVSSITATVAMSTDTTRVATMIQAQDCPSSTDRIYWSMVNVSTNSAWVLEGDYFTPDDPSAWQGKIELLGSALGCKAIIYEWYSTGYPFNY